MVLELRFFDILALGFIAQDVVNWGSIVIEFSIYINFSHEHQRKELFLLVIFQVLYEASCAVFEYVSHHIIACNFCPSYKIVLVYTQTLGQMLPCVVCAPPVLRGPMQWGMERWGRMWWIWRWYLQMEGWLILPGRTDEPGSERIYTCILSYIYALICTCS